MDKNLEKDILITAMITKIIEVIDNDPSPFYQQLISSCYAHLDGVKEHMQGGWIPTGGMNVSAAFDVDDDQNSTSSNGSGGGQQNAVSPFDPDPDDQYYDELDDEEDDY